jgi:hypothetical protein
VLNLVSLLSKTLWKVAGVLLHCLRHCRYSPLSLARFFLCALMSLPRAIFLSGCEPQH